MKCGQCKEKAKYRIKVSEREVRHLCVNHYDIWDKKGDIHKVVFTRASKL